ncbi:MAG: nicotinate-nucleotide--dimethylbenzimidazole phosphoribosyltransferase [Butyrivibrio sp.]|jgi:nicotinate-nucleotide--dimethylbenzimidazole phosphoribosyltransferase|nr:nicotinate-nucleotide--dimethylbenzimidazole phosphoribosyltransferase [Butyrivibrio sp.]
MNMEKTGYRIQVPDEKAMQACRERWNAVAKPLNGLGRFETLLTQIAGITESADVCLDRRAVVVMCADNGIVAEGVTQTDQSVTAVVAENIAKGKGNISRMAQTAHADVLAVDIGIAGKIPEGSGVLNRKVSSGTNDFVHTPAMTPEQVSAALQTGVTLAGELKESGYQILATGEMGIGNTTTGTAVTAALLHADSDRLTGRGAGLDGQSLQRKKKVIRDAIQKYDLQNADPMKVLSCVGGLDICGMAGLFIGGALYHIPVVIDGCISAAAALAAERIAPGCSRYMIPSHCSREPVQNAVFLQLGLQAVIDADMALGEGTGAVMMFPLLDMVLSVYHSTVTFTESSLEAYHSFSD